VRFLTSLLTFNLSHPVSLYEGASLRDVELHKHLGVIFSNDCKWTKHIDKLIEKSSKQINVLSKLKFKLKRNYLEQDYYKFCKIMWDF
jgi:hypothetical protein